MDIAAYLFDMDGTLLDSEILWVKAVERLLQDKGHPIPHATALRLVYGRAWQDIYADLRRLLGENLADCGTAEAELRVYFERLKLSHDITIPGSVRLLRELSRQHPVCVVSGAPREDVRRGVALMGVEDCLAFFLGSEDYTPGKPSPACFLAAAARLGVNPAQCVVFEDSAAGVLAAKAAGMTCVALARETAPAQNVDPADLILADLDHFSPLLLAKKVRSRSR